MRPLPPLRALQIFEIMGHSQNLADAARRLDITPGAISQQLKLLESTLNIELTFKEGKRIRLTSAGLRLHGACSQAFELLREAHAELERGKNATNLSLSALPSLLKSWLAPLVFEWQESHYPDLTIQFKGSHSEPANELEDIDFRITYGNNNVASQNSVELYTDSVVPVCSPSLLGPRTKLNRPADILNYPLLSTDWSPKFTSPPSWDDWFDANEVNDTRAATSSYRIFSLSHMAIDAAIAGHGFVLAQCSMIASDVAAGRLLIPFKRALPLPWPYILTWNPNVFHKPHCSAFHRWLVSRGKLQNGLNERLLA